MYIINKVPIEVKNCMLRIQFDLLHNLFSMKKIQLNCSSPLIKLYRVTNLYIETIS